MPAKVISDNTVLIFSDCRTGICTVCSYLNVLYILIFSDCWTGICSYRQQTSSWRQNTGLNQITLHKHYTLVTRQITNTYNLLICNKCTGRYILLLLTLTTGNQNAEVWKCLNGVTCSQIDMESRNPEWEMFRVSCTQCTGAQN